MQSEFPARPLRNRLDRAAFRAIVGDQELAGTQLALRSAAPTSSKRAALRRHHGDRRRASSSASGRKPCGSRKANSALSVSPTTVAAPSSRAMAAVSASSSGSLRRLRSAPRSARSPRGRPERLAELRAQRLGVHEVAVVAQCDCSRVLPWWTMGCAFAHALAPVVEYRLWPIASSPWSADNATARRTPARPGRGRARLSAGRLRWTAVIPADSCSAVLERKEASKYASRATSRPGARIPKTPHISRPLQARPCPASRAPRRRPRSRRCSSKRMTRAPR